jgi:hypothetical protein
MAKPTLGFVVWALALIVLTVYATGAGMQNRGFVIAGYGLTWGTLLWYARRLDRRAAATKGALDRLAETSGG